MTFPARIPITHDLEVGMMVEIHVGDVSEGLGRITGIKHLDNAPDIITVKLFSHDITMHYPALCITRVVFRRSVMASIIRNLTRTIA